MLSARSLAHVIYIACVAGTERGGGGGGKLEGKNVISREEYILISSSKVLQVKTLKCQID